MNEIQIVTQDASEKTVMDQLHSAIIERGLREG